MAISEHEGAESAIGTGEFTELPILDLAEWRGDREQKAAFAETVRSVCHDVGFFYVVNHGVEQQFVDAVFAMMRRFFDLPLEQKQLIDKVNSPHFRGWEGVGTELTNGVPDMREQIDLWTDHPPRAADVEPPYLRLLGENQRLADDILAGYNGMVTEFFDRMGAVARELMEVLSVALGLAPGHIEHVFGEEQMSLVKLIRYPPTPAGDQGVGAHHDAGFLTVLIPGETAGLQVENGLGEWVDAPALPGAFVINLGEMLQGMTGNYFVATPHRVVTDDERYSCAYFHGPSLDTELSPLQLDASYAEAVAASPRHSGAGFMARAEEIDAGVGEMQATKPDVYGEQLWNYFSRSYPDNMAAHYPKG